MGNNSLDQTGRAGQSGMIEPISGHRELVCTGAYKIAALPWDTPRPSTDTLNPLLYQDYRDND